MRLYTCHVDHFGVLQDLDLDFRDRLHAVYEENGWGKSTLAAFLLVMFYGFANEKSRSEISNERRRFAPWQPGIYGGTVTFSRGGRILRLERVFGRKNAAEDRTVVYDAETNLPVDDLPENPGEVLFAIDRESFARTVFIAQQDCGTEATSGIQAKIGHLEGEEADMADFHQVQASLKKTADRLTPHRKTGEIYRVRQEMAALEAEISRRPVYEETMRKLNEQLDLRTRELQQLRNETERRQKELRQLAVIQRTAEDFTLDEEEQRRLEELETMFVDGIPEPQQLEEAEACLCEIRRMRSAFDEAQRELYEPDRETGTEQPARSGTSLVAVGVFALLASALLAFFVNRPVAAGLAALAVVIMVIVMRRDRKKENEEGRKRPSVTVKQPASPMHAVVAARKKREFLQEKRKEILAAEGELLAFLRHYDPELTEEEDLSRRLQQLQYESGEYRSLSKKKERFRAAEQERQASVREAQAALAERFGDGETVTTEDWESLIAINKSRMAEAESEEENIRRQIEIVREELDRAGESEERLTAVREQLAEMQHRYEVITQTREYLARARTAFTARHMEPVRRAFDRYYRMLTGGETKEYQLDADLKIAVRECGLLRDPAFLSEGWQDLIGLCRRMAMIDTMYEEEKPFLLLDDPFVNLDGEKLRRALQFLRQLAEQYQVIYFTCHESRVP